MAIPAPFPFTTGQVLTAAQMNTLGDFQSWTPTITAQAGTFTLITTNWARYAVLNEVIFAQIKFTITTLGTGAGIIRVSLPTGITIPTESRVSGSWREQNVNGLTGVFQQNSSTVVEMHRYDNGAVTIANGQYSGSFFWEIV